MAKSKNTATSRRLKPGSVQSTAQLAEYLGLSRWTVSRIINGHSGFHHETVERVKQAMKEFNFRPNPMAAALKGERADLVGICFPGFSGQEQKLAALQNLLVSKKKRILIEATNGNSELEREIIHHLLFLNVDGILLTGMVLTQNPDMVELLVNRGIPTVLMDDSSIRLPFAKVSVNRAKAVSLAIDHLYQRGHRKFALLGFNPNSEFYGFTRIKGIRDSLKHLKLSLEKNFEFFPDNGLEYENPFYKGEYLIERLLKKKSPPPAIITTNDILAVGALKRLKSDGYSIPEDFSIIGFGNMDIARYTDPPLTTIDSRLELEASTAVQLLYEQVEGKHSSSDKDLPSILIEPLLIDRDSVGSV